MTKTDNVVVYNSVADLGLPFKEFRLDHFHLAVQAFDGETPKQTEERIHKLLQASGVWSYSLEPVEGDPGEYGGRGWVRTKGDRERESADLSSVSDVFRPPPPPDPRYGVGYLKRVAQWIGADGKVQRTWAHLTGIAKYTEEQIRTVARCGTSQAAADHIADEILSEILKTAKPQWTRGLPPCAGYYWLHLPGCCPYPVDVHRSEETGQLVVFKHCKGVRDATIGPQPDGSKPDIPLDAEWFGPIYEPELTPSALADAALK